MYLKEPFKNLNYPITDLILDMWPPPLVLPQYYNDSYNDKIFTALLTRGGYNYIINVSIEAYMGKSRFFSTQTKPNKSEGLKF